MRTQRIPVISIFILLLLPLLLHSQEKMSIMTYNIRNGVGIDNIADYERTADVIKKYHPDIVAIQEVDSVTNRSNQRFVIKDIAKFAGLNYVFAPAISYDGGKYGIGILSKEKPLKTYQKQLPGREEQRTFLVAEFQDYIFICVHLSLTPEDQVISMNIIRDELKKMRKPIFIAGDFNAEPNSETVKLLKQKFDILTPLGTKTYPADSPIEAIDYIAIDKRLSKTYSLNNASVLYEPIASDHRPILVELSIVGK